MVHQMYNVEGTPFWIWLKQWIKTDEGDWLRKIISASLKKGSNVVRYNLGTYHHGNIVHDDCKLKNNWMKNKSIKNNKHHEIVIIQAKNV